MDIPNKSHILVMDGSKMFLFRNDGGPANPELTIIEHREQDSAPTQEQGSSGPGTGFQSFGSARSSYEQTDFHQQDEDRFAVEAAEMLKDEVLAHRIDALIIVAAPQTLGELRKNFHTEVEKRVIGQISKNVAGHPTDQILAAIAAGSESA